MAGVDNALLSQLSQALSAKPITWTDDTRQMRPGGFHPEFDGRVQGERDIFRRYGKPPDMAVTNGPYIVQGWINEEQENAYSAMAAAALGIKGQEPWWALTDWIIANWDVLRAFPADTPAKPQTPTPTAPTPPPPGPAPVSGGLSSPEQRVEELWAWVNQQWPIVRPIAVQALKMFRKAIGRQ